MKRIGQQFGPRDNAPYVAYFQFKKSEESHPLVRVLKKGQEIAGLFLASIPDTSSGFNFTTHLLRLKAGRATLKGGASINKALEGIPRNTPILIKYLGEGEAKPGRRPARLFEVYDMTEEYENGDERFPTQEEILAQQPSVEAAEAKKPLKKKTVKVASVEDVDDDEDMDDDLSL